MIPYYDNPVPKEDAEGVNIQDEPYDIGKDWATIADVVKSTSSQFTDDWNETVEYAIKARAGNLRYPHISVYDREGDLECKDNIFYRMMDCQISTITLASHCTLMLRDCAVTEMTGGMDCHIVLKAVDKLQKISGLTNCYVVLEQCALQELCISECRGCKFEIRENVKFPAEFTPNEFQGAERIKGNISTQFYIKNVKFIGEGDAGIVSKNEECYLWTVNTTVTSGIWMKDNRYCYVVAKDCTFGPNLEWIAKNDLGSHWTSEGTTYKENQHGWNAKGLIAVYQYDTFEGCGSKVWHIRNSRVTLIHQKGVLGSDKIFVAKDCTFFFHKSNIESGQSISVAWEDFDITDKQPPALLLPAIQTAQKDKKYVLRLQDYVQRTDRDFEVWHENARIESYTVTGLPPGLTANEQTGEISGTPSEVGDYEVTISVKDEVGSSESYGISSEMQQSSQEQSSKLKFTITEPKFPETAEASPPGEKGWVAPPDPK